MFEQLREVTAQLTAPGAPFEIHQVEVNGISVRAYAGAAPTLRHVWEASAAFGDADFLVYEDERLTYAEAHAAVRRLAGVLAERYGVGVGDRVALAMRNYPEWIIGYWATVSLGAAVVGMNAWWTAAELAFGLSDATPKVVVADAERVERVLAARADTGVIPVLAVRDPNPPAEQVTRWDDVMAGAPEVELPALDLDPDTDACIFYTSGTTGFPKGAQLTHRGCTNNIMNLFFWNAAAPLAVRAAAGDVTAASAAPAAPVEQMAYLVNTPLFHVTACNCVLHPATVLGAKLVLMHRWDALRALELIQAERIVAMSGVPTMSRELVTHPRFAEFDTSSLRSVGGGGAPLQPDLVEKIDDTVATARPGTGYGMTETCGVISMTSADFFRAKPHTAGPPLPVFEVRIVDADGNDVAPGGLGELWVRGAPVIRGYLNRPEATAETITDGFVHTGDIARLDEDGFLAIVDRAKDMVLRGGENVYCAEVEAAIFAHPAVRECAVFGVPDGRLGEEVGAVVVIDDGLALADGDLRDFLTARIARFKVPRYLWLQREPLPRNASGKFLKRELREKAIADMVVETTGGAS
jgi:long-chain acyl-CoA synthetase